MAAARILLRSDREANVGACARGRRVKAVPEWLFRNISRKGYRGIVARPRATAAQSPPDDEPAAADRDEASVVPISRTSRAAARTHARLDNPFSISSYRPNCSEIAPGEGQRVLDSNPGERTAIFTSLTPPR